MTNQLRIGKKIYGTRRRLSSGAAGCAWRIEYKGAFYHVLSRGNEKQDIVINDDDRKLFLTTVGKMAERFEIDLFAYVLMDNRYHLLFRTNRANLCRSMQWFGATYTKRFNLRHNRSGHLFLSEA